MKEDDVFYNIGHTYIIRLNFYFMAHALDILRGCLIMFVNFIIDVMPAYSSIIDNSSQILFYIYFLMQNDG